jgi:CRP-like cAMP-binding protein
VSDVYAELMTTFPLFKDYTRHGTSALIQRGHIRELGQGDLLFKEGDPAKVVSLILTGEAEIFVDRRGQPLLLDEGVGPGRVLGELAVLGGTNRPASARATCPTAVLEWNDGEFRRLIAHDVDLSHRIFRELIRTLAMEEEALVASLAAVKESEHEK